MEFTKLLLQIITPCVTALIAIFGLVYQNNQRLKQEKLVAKQAQYEKIIKNIFKLFYVRPGIEYAEALNEVENSWLYASDPVLIECYKILEIHKRISAEKSPLEELKLNTELVSEFNQCLQQLFLIMRKDLNFGNNKNARNWPIEHVVLFPLGVLAIEDKGKNEKFGLSSTFKSLMPNQ